jgi:hypothetical protein
VARPIGPVSPYCHCPRCVTRSGLSILRSEVNAAAITVGAMMDLLEHHFSGRGLLRMRVGGMLVLDALSDAALGQQKILADLERATSGRCLTRGILTLRDEAAERRLLARYN